LVTVSATAILVVYSAGYVRTQSASEEFVRRMAEHRVAAVSARVASVQDGLDAKVTLFQPGDSPSSDHPSSAAPAAPKTWIDGKYNGWGYSRHGDIEAEVTIKGGRIASAAISQCRTRYPCSVIDILPPQVAQRQSPDVDYVSGATQSADAFYEAVVAALNKAR
jgi:uncharacterized protein with FMN-binding domain